MRALYKGISVNNEASFIVNDYLFRKSMRKKGYYDRLEDLDCFSADCFTLIDIELNELQDKEMKRAKRK